MGHVTLNIDKTETRIYSYSKCDENTNATSQQNQLFPLNGKNSQTSTIDFFNFIKLSNFDLLRRSSEIILSNSKLINLTPRLSGGTRESQRL